MYQAGMTHRIVCFSPRSDPGAKHTSFFVQVLFTVFVVRTRRGNEGRAPAVCEGGSLHGGCYWFLQFLSCVLKSEFMIFVFQKSIEDSSKLVCNFRFVFSSSPSQGCLAGKVWSTILDRLNQWSFGGRVWRIWNRVNLIQSSDRVLCPSTFQKSSTLLFSNSSQLCRFTSMYFRGIGNDDSCGTFS